MPRINLGGWGWRLGEGGKAQGGMRLSCDLLVGWGWGTLILAFAPQF